MSDEQQTYLAIIENVTPMTPYESKEKAESVISSIRQKVDEFKKTADISTEAGRKEIASFAYKIAQSKTAVEAAGSKLTEDHRAAVTMVNKEKNNLVAQLQALQDEARKPLTDWENLEKKRKEDRSNLIKFCETASYFIGSPTIDDIEQTIKMVEGIDAITTKDEFSARLELAKFKSLESLNQTLAAKRKQIAEEIELATLRKQQQEREEQERIQKAADAAAEKVRQEAAAAAEAERQRVANAAKAAADAAAERERKLLTEKEAADAALKKAEADKVAAAEKSRLDKIAAEEKAKKDAEAAVEAERQRVAAIEEADRKAAKAREDDINHKRVINNTIHSCFLAAFHAVQADELTADEAAKKLIVLIAKGEIPNVSITY